MYLPVRHPGTSVACDIIKTCEQLVRNNLGSKSWGIMFSVRGVKKNKGRGGERGGKGERKREKEGKEKKNKAKNAKISDNFR